jgi:hypothetical protein
VISGRDMKQSSDAESSRDPNDDTGGEDLRRGVRPQRRAREAASASA